MARWYGNIMNRLEEGRQFVEEIKVGTGVTEYHYSDRTPWEVVEVKDQKHFTIRMMDHKHIGDGVMDNRWELISNPENACRSVERRGDVWYFVNTVTAEEIKDMDMETNLRLVLAGFDPEKIREKGKQTRRYKANISVGHADYYYDYEF